ncbi:MAG: BON domain-containing protein [Acidimicrobiia bacterium]|nr:BON domain-containing protein [Acidimicrobiia bacterium]
MIFLLTLPFRVLGLGFKLGRGSTKVTHRTLRLVGYRRLFVLGTGVAIGLMIAPMPGDRMRARVKTMVEGLAGGGPADLAAKVRDELSSSPRTWHLPQPGVVATQGRVVLTGEVPHATAAGDLERAAAAVKGVLEVDNQLRVASN